MSVSATKSTKPTRAKKPRGRLVPIDPPSLGDATGYANGILAPRGGRLLFIAGQVAWDRKKKLVGGKRDMAAQFAQALRNVLAVVHAAGGEASDVAQLTVFVADVRAYARARKAIGAEWRALMGRYFPAMALVEVSALLERGALVEIQGVAVVP